MIDDMPDAAEQATVRDLEERVERLELDAETITTDLRRAAATLRHPHRRRTPRV